MPAFTDLARNVKLKNGESFVGLFDPSKDVKVTETEDYGTRYTFLFVAEDAKLAIIKGGERLRDAIDRCIGNRGTPVKLKITAKGDARTLERDYEVKMLGAPQ